MNVSEIIEWYKRNGYRKDGAPNPNLSRVSYCKKKGEEYLDFHSSAIHHTKFLDCVKPSLHFRMMCIFNNITTIPKCPVCGSEVKKNWNGKEIINKPFNTYCSAKCSRNDEVVKEKAKKTNLEKYGVENPLHTKEVRENNRKQRYTPDEWVERFKKHYDDRFEYLYVGSNKCDVRCKKHNHYFSVRKHDLASGRTNCPICRVESLSKRYTYPEEKFVRLLKEVQGDLIKLGGEYDGMHTSTKFICNQHGEFESKPYQMLQGQNCPKCYNGSSKQEESLVDYVQGLVDYDLITNSRKVIKGKEIDIFCEPDNLLIEYNGLYWHSDKFINKGYHIHKTRESEMLGYQLLHINSNEWTDQIKKKIWMSIIRNKLGQCNSRFYARKCDVKEINNQKYKEFLDINHLQGYAPSKVRIGLFNNDELISVMSFSKSRFNRKYEYELVRYACKRDYSVVGGASKMFNWFVKVYEPKSIVSYADRRLSKGNLYRKLGFEFVRYTTPNYFYTKDFKNILSRHSCQKHKLKGLLGSNFDESLSEYENMTRSKYFRIYDSGNMVFEWHCS